MTTLDSHLADLSISGLEAAPGVIRELTRAGDELLPEFGELAVPTGDILGGASRLGTGALDFGINALLQPVLDTLGALAPLASLFGDALHVAGEAAEFVWSNIGRENLGAFAGTIETVVGVTRLFAETLYNVGEAFGVWDFLADSVVAIGDGFGYVYDVAGSAYDAVAGGAEWVLGKIIDLHNALNDVPGAAEMSSLISSEDIEMPDLSGGPGGATVPPATAPSATAATIESSAIASLPSSAATPGSTSSSTGTASTAATTTAAPGATAAQPPTAVGGGGTTYNQTFNNEITVEGGMPRSNADLRKMIRKMHNELQRRQRKQNSPGA